MSFFTAKVHVIVLEVVSGALTNSFLRLFRFSENSSRSYRSVKFYIRN